MEPHIRHSSVVAFIVPLVLLVACAPIQPRTPTLRWTVVNGYDTLTVLEVFDDGLLTFEREGSRRRHRADPTSLATLRAVIADPAWHRELDELRRRFDPATTPVGDLAFVFETDGQGSRLWARVPAEEMTATLRSFLTIIDEVFAQTFAGSYAELWSTARPAQTPSRNGSTTSSPPRRKPCWRCSVNSRRHDALRAV